MADRKLSELSRIPRIPESVGEPLRDITRSWLIINVLYPPWMLYRLWGKKYRGRGEKNENEIWSVAVSIKIAIPKNKV